MKRSVKVGAACAALCMSICVMSFLKTPHIVYAGDINSEEQRVINYYNQTFTYNGKNYVATDAAKQAAYNKLAADGTDLTKAQVDSMILQANASIAQGIESGYLVEVSSDGTTTETTETEATETESTETEATETESTETEATETESTENESTESTESESTETENDTENNDPVQIDDNADGDAGDSTTGRRIDLNTLIDMLSEDGTDNIEMYLPDGTRVSVTDLAESVWQKQPFIITQYGSRISTAVKEDGTVLYQSSLPVKNTGYTTGMLFLIPLILLAGMAVVVCIGIKLRRKKGVFLVTSLTMTGVVIAAAALGGADLLKSCLADYRTVWIAGAPAYSYTETEWLQLDSGQIERPIVGNQYARLQCETIGLECPLYMGDSDEVFELGAGTYTGGYLPGENGTILVGGHDTSFFAPLADAEIGDVLEISTNYGVYQYEVTETRIAEVTDTETYQIGTGTEELILYTCYPFGDTGKVRNERFFVYAKRVDTTGSEE